MEAKVKKLIGTNKRRIIAIVLCALAAASAVLAAIVGGAAQGMKPIEARNGIVWVYATIYSSQGELLAGGSGTGWAIGRPGEPVVYIVTNGHVVQYAYEYPKEKPYEYIGELSIYFSAAENDAVTPKVVYYSPPDEKDIAILKLPSPTNKRIPLTLRPSGTVEAGETAYALGYPGISSERQDYVKFDVSDITITKGVISKRTTVNYTEYEAFQMDVAIAGGNSGGPLVDEQGFVLGINTLGAVKYINDETSVDLGMNYAIVIDELSKILDNERIPYTLKGANSGDAVIYWVLAVLLLAAGVFLWLKKPQAAPNTAAAPAGAKTPMLRGISGRYAGEKFDLSHAKLTLGRDPARCNIVFDANTPGISSCHCSVYYDAHKEGFMLTDEGSSYGTFLSNGKKLTAAIPEKLTAGDGFYLADGANRFVVTRE